MSQTEQNVTTEVKAPEPKLFSEDYVKTIREEAKENRLARKAAEEERDNLALKFKDVIGLKPEDPLKDESITLYKENLTKNMNAALEKANERLLQAEIKSLDGYDVKLVSRLLDRSKVTIEEDGTIKGLKEAVEELENEFPQIRKGTVNGGANPPTNNVTEIEALELKLQEAQKAGDPVTVVSLTNKIFELRHKK